MDQQINVCLSVCMSVNTAVPIPVERKEKDQRGSYEASIRFTRLGGLERIRLQITDKPVDGCHRKGCLEGFPHLQCRIRVRDTSIIVLEPHLIIRFYLSSSQRLPAQHHST